MSLPRFYYTGALDNPKVGTEATLSEQASHHIQRVLRLRVGQSILLFNETGYECECTIKNIGKHISVTVVIQHCQRVNRESSLMLTLVQGLSSGERMDYTLQKAVELGVRSLQPVSTERSVVHLNEDRARKREAHWQHLVISACEQCGRNIVPKVQPILGLYEWFQKVSKLPAEQKGLQLILLPDASTSLRDIPKPLTGITVLAGPEGGFSKQEQQAALDAGCLPVRLGPRILRTETAALAALSAIHALWGDF